MAALSISLSVARDARFAPIPGHTSLADRSVARLRSEVIQQARHQRRCAGCDFAFGTSDQFELHHLDGDHTNNDASNLVPICEMCHAAFHLDLVARRWRGAPGRIIFLPELTQGQLNNLLQAIFFAKRAQQQSTGVGAGLATAPTAASSDKEAAPGTGPLIRVHSLHMALERRADLTEQLPDGTIGRPGLSQPSTMARVLSEMSDADYARRDVLLHGLRYLPAEQRLLSAAEEWGRHGSSFAQLAVESWASIAGIAA